MIINDMFELTNNNGTWTVFDHNNGARGHVLATGSRARVAQAMAICSGKFSIFWYEVMIELNNNLLTVSPVQVAKIGRLSYKQLFALNGFMAARPSNQHLDTWLETNVA